MKKCQYNKIPEKLLENQCFEQVIEIYNRNIYNALFYKKEKNAFMVTMINIFHIIGVLYIFIGILSPPKYLTPYIIYLISLMVLYHVYDNICFMTLFANDLSNKNNAPLKIRMKTVNIIITIYLLIAIVSKFIPQVSPYNIVIYIISNLNNIPSISYYFPVITLYSFLLLHLTYVFFR